MPTTNRIISETQNSDKVSSANKSKAGNTPTAKVPDYEPNIPEPKCRADLIKHWVSLTLDDRTANKMLWITDGGAKVARMTDDVTCPVLERPERYEYTPQVLCREGIAGFRGYWEVRSAGWVVIGVAFERAGRRNSEGPCGFGENHESWGLEWSGSGYQVWHQGQKEEIHGIPHHATIGVYADQPAGLLSFYAVEEEEEEGAVRKEVKLLHQVRSCFQQKLLPGFWVGTNSYCLILQKEE